MLGNDEPMMSDFERFRRGCLIERWKFYRWPIALEHHYRTYRRKAVGRYVVPPLIWRGRNGAPDGRRYKALGNSMAVNVMRWIGERIQLVENLRRL